MTAALEFKSLGDSAIVHSRLKLGNFTCGPRLVFDKSFTQLFRLGLRLDQRFIDGRYVRCDLFTGCEVALFDIQVPTQPLDEPRAACADQQRQCVTICRVQAASVPT